MQCKQVLLDYDRGRTVRHNYSQAAGIHAAADELQIVNTSECSDSAGNYRPEP